MSVNQTSITVQELQRGSTRELGRHSFETADMPDIILVAQGKESAGASRQRALEVGRDAHRYRVAQHLERGEARRALRRPVGHHPLNYAECVVSGCVVRNDNLRGRL